MFRAYLGLVKKEFIQVTRDKEMLRVIFIAPIVQLLLLGYAVNTDVKLLATDIYDFDQSHYSREFGRSLEAGDYFTLDARLPERENRPLWNLEERFQSGKAELAFILPENFSEKLTAGENVSIGLMADGSDANAARTGLAYARQIVRQFSQRISGFSMPVKIRQKFLYNPELESVYFMVPGIVATLLTAITVMLTSMAIVRERELGTLEQLTVTPISITSLLMGKVTTFAILGLVEMAFALTVGVLWFKIPFIGSAWLLLLFSWLYLLTTLGMGMFFSTITATQQQAMFLAWFFSVFAILTSGFFTPITNMPELMQYVTLVNPMRYFVEVVRGIMLKGSGFSDLLPNAAALAAYGITIFSLSALRFKKRAA